MSTRRGQQPETPPDPRGWRDAWLPSETGLRPGLCGRLLLRPTGPRPTAPRPPPRRSQGPPSPCACPLGAVTWACPGPGHGSAPTVRVTAARPPSTAEASWPSPPATSGHMGVLPAAGQSLGVQLSPLRGTRQAPRDSPAQDADRAGAGTPRGPGRRSRPCGAGPGCTDCDQAGARAGPRMAGHRLAPGPVTFAPRAIIAACPENLRRKAGGQAADPSSRGAAHPSRPERACGARVQGAEPTASPPRLPSPPPPAPRVTGSQAVTAHVGISTLTFTGVK